MSIHARNALFVVVFGVAGCTGEVPADDVKTAGQALKSGSPDDWTVSTYDAMGTSFNDQERRIGPRNVGQLQVDWVFDGAAAGAPVTPLHATPAVSKGRTYIGSWGGRFYAIGKDGELLWQMDTARAEPELAAFAGDHSPILAGAALPKGENSVVVGDIAGVVYKLDRTTGQELWRTDVDHSTFGGVWGGILAVGNVLYVALGSFEPLAPWVPGYPCCSHRGGLVALDLASGAELWRYEAITAAQQGPLPPALIAQLNGAEVFGPSGGDVWSQPTYDADTNTVYISTGQLFSRNASGGGPNTFDAIIAIDASNGHSRWVTQLSDTLDVYRFDVPNPDPVTGKWSDRDISGQPKIYTLGSGRHARKVVAAGQKDGRLHVLDARTGAVIRSNPLITQASSEGGLQTGGAAAYGMLFEHGVTTTMDAGSPYDGVVMGVSGDGATVKWSIRRPASPIFAGLTVANGVLYFESPFEEGVSHAGQPPTWALYAVDPESGNVLSRLEFTNNRAMNQPVVTRGRLYVPFGDSVAHGLAGGVNEGGLMALGLPGDEDEDCEE